MENANAKPRVPTCLFCLTCYFMALVAISFIVLPADAFAFIGGFQVDPEGYPVALAMAGVFLILGGILHALFHWLNPAKFDWQTFKSAGFVILIVMASLLGLSLVVTRGTGLSPTILSNWLVTALMWIGIGLVTFLALMLALFYLKLRSHPANRVARRLQAGYFSGAIRVAESLPPNDRDFSTNINLAIAYVLSKQTEKAKVLLATLEHSEVPTTECSPETRKQALDHVRALMEHEAHAGDPPPPRQ